MYSVGSIKNKESNKRELFLVVGDFQSYEDFSAAFQKALLSPEDYDFRTIRWLENYENVSPHILMFNHLDDVEAYDTYSIKP
jgi:hypothetical protein